jgi:NAD(P)-dependent dehydrogenase (short-subunit alcohol dehydrogenase family)
MGERTWLVTGASRGLGRALVEAVLAHGDRVVATARDAGALDDLAAEHGDRVLTRDLDVTDRAAVFAVVNQVAAETGRIDVLVANAGYGLAGGVEEVTEEQARRQVEVNLFGALWTLQAVLPTMRAQQRGHLLPISSIGGVGAFPNTGLYHATKWGLEGLSESGPRRSSPSASGRRSSSPARSAPTGTARAWSARPRCTPTTRCSDRAARPWTGRARSPSPATPGARARR